MSSEAPLPVSADPPGAGLLSPFEQIRYAREIVKLEGTALIRMGDCIDTTFCEAVEQLYHCAGSVIVSGMGKAGLIGQKIAATLASTGTRSHFLHPAEAFHGDLGRIHRDDVVLLLSQSGETDEVTRLLPSLEALGVPVIAVTASRSTTLAQAATVVIELGPLREACSLGLAPSTSTTVMLACGDALALVTSRMRGFSATDFARFHPGGSLGRRLSQVDDHMRPLKDCRLAHHEQTVRAVLVAAAVSGRRTGAIMLTDDDGRLCGIFTDSDLARLFEGHHEACLDRPVHHVMTATPVTVPGGSLVDDAARIMAERKISELPVVADSRCPLGLVDITDLVSRKLVADDDADE